MLFAKSYRVHSRWFMSAGNENSRCRRTRGQIFVANLGGLVWSQTTDGGQIILTSVLFKSIRFIHDSRCRSDRLRCSGLSHIKRNVKTLSKYSVTPVLPIYSSFIIWYYICTNFQRLILNIKALNNILPNKIHQKSNIRTECYIKNKIIALKNIPKVLKKCN